MVPRSSAPARATSGFVRHVKRSTASDSAPLGGSLPAAWRNSVAGRPTRRMRLPVAFSSEVTFSAASP
jgi:hypothetical protein